MEKINKEPAKWDGEIKAVRFIPPVKVGDLIFQHSDGHCVVIKPRYKVGETVYIKEAWAKIVSPCEYIKYKLDDPVPSGDWGKWRSPLLMPSKFARYFITIKDVRAERLQEITEEDAEREGVVPAQLNKEYGCLCISQGRKHICTYIDLWDSINENQKWNTNPFVWRYEFSYSRSGLNEVRNEYIS